jgi:hypothetical protein
MGTSASLHPTFSHQFHLPHKSRMHLLTTVILLASSILAAPTPQTATNPSITHLYVCTDASFRGTCNNLNLPVSQCSTSPPSPHPFTFSLTLQLSLATLGPDLSRKISSMGPDSGTFCTMYSEPNCVGKALPFTNPGISALKRYNYDDTGSSVRCDFIAGWKDHP